MCPKNVLVRTQKYCFLVQNEVVIAPIFLDLVWDFTLFGEEILSKTPKSTEKRCENS